MASCGWASAPAQTGSIPCWRPGRRPWARAMAASIWTRRSSSGSASPPTTGVRAWRARWSRPAPVWSCSPQPRARSSGSCASGSRPKLTPACGCRLRPCGRRAIGACRWGRLPCPNPASCCSRAWAGPSPCLSRSSGAWIRPPRRRCSSPRPRRLCWCAPAPTSCGMWAWAWCCPPASPGAWPAGWACRSRPSCRRNRAASPWAKRSPGNGNS